MNKITVRNIDSRPVSGFEKYYLAFTDSSIYSIRSKRFLKPANNGTGYLQVCFCVDGKKTHHYVQKVFAAAFLVPVEGKRFVNHLDNNPLNNDVSNLAYCSAKENSQYAARQGRMKGFITTEVKLTSDKVLAIKQLLTRNTFSQSQIATLFDVSRHLISRIKTGRSWKSISLN